VCFYIALETMLLCSVLFISLSFMQSMIELTSIDIRTCLAEAGQTNARSTREVKNFMIPVPLDFLFGCVRASSFFVSTHPFDQNCAHLSSLPTL
jgi:hypothetical protein